MANTLSYLVDPQTGNNPFGEIEIVFYPQLLDESVCDAAARHCVQNDMGEHSNGAWFAGHCNRCGWSFDDGRREYEVICYESQCRRGVHREYSASKYFHTQIEARVWQLAFHGDCDRVVMYNSKGVCK